MIPLSVLDLAPVCAGSDASASLANSRDLARHAEALGYHRYWLAEHHGMPGIASAATSVVIADIAAATSTIRVGSGGVMLPNHAPLLIAEQFGTLAALHPGRIDLGLGRAPGTDQRTAQAIRRSLVREEDFVHDVMELQAYFAGTAPVLATPGRGLEVPIWILGSSLYGAQLAAALGLPYAFASHFAPAALDEAVAVYRQRFQPSPAWPKPYLMVAANVIAAPTEAEARFLFTSLQQAFVNLRTGQPGLLPAPVERLPFDEELLRRTGAGSALSVSAIGDPAQVGEALRAIVARTGADELILTAQIHDHAARRRSFAIAAEAMGLTPLARAA
ncbi:luciferase family oxidoreductase group 1 [Endobacter medicaginis]|uniref:Luciferase-like monooxygenase n=1 Tax=Endobacter medicaginis TaxID=1181271 RepID=A0A839UTS3_9PROT|nr:LLM class flavin-dependent oxidoreductase [Endobacter medicaginis]MBB3173197.1 luciferase family oxidoreductase group 1 [Endobacter medicaginis]MCX5476621.1 LLM class flavin-dependent oxidoreductase [Endobacter medicaginis]NVN31619.1 LLM class flavin-dependent oxidoreductase [Endobacter medicaginis]